MKKGKRMNHCVPDFEMEDDFELPTSSSLARPKKSTMQEDEIMELLWQNGQVVMQSQTQRSSLKKQSPPSKYEDAVLPATQTTATREIQTQPQHLFMQEDEMASWLHYPLNDANFDQDFCSDLLYPPSAPDAGASCAASSATTSTTITNTVSLPLRGVMQQYPEVRPLPAARPPIHPGRKADVAQNFSHFSRHHQRSTTPAETESGPSNPKSVVRELTVVDSCVTPSTDAMVGRSMVGGSSGDHTCGTMSGDAAGASVSGIGVASSAKEVMMITTTCDTTVTSSPGCSSASAEPRPQPPLPLQKPIVEDRKRKGKEEEVERQSEDVEFESAEPKKQVCGSTSKKRSRAAEVHNLSERRRRDRINEKMRALQELIPRCNKSDKASMLDEAIEYLKSLQLQVQMMSMGCSMVPMMFPGIQQYMPPMGMGMGIGMGMEMGLNRPMIPFPNVLAGAPSSTPAAAAHLCPRFPMPTFHMPPVPAPDSSRVQPTSQPDSMLLTSLGTQSPNPPRVPNFADSYHQYLGLHQMQTAPTQNPPMAQPVTSKPSTSRGPENLDNRQAGT